MSKRLLVSSSESASLDQKSALSEVDMGQKVPSGRNGVLIGLVARWACSVP